MKTETGTCWSQVQSSKAIMLCSYAYARFLEKIKRCMLVHADKPVYIDISCEGPGTKRSAASDASAARKKSRIWRVPKADDRWRHRFSATVDDDTIGWDLRLPSVAAMLSTCQTTHTYRQIITNWSTYQTINRDKCEQHFPQDMDGEAWQWNAMFPLIVLQCARKSVVFERHIFMPEHLNVIHSSLCNPADFWHRSLVTESRWIFLLIWHFK